MTRIFTFLSVNKAVPFLSHFFEPTLNHYCGDNLTHLVLLTGFVSVFKP